MDESTLIMRLAGIGVCVAALSAAAGLLIVLSQRWHGKHTLDHDLDSVQKFHTTAVPRIGGLAILGAIFLTLTLAEGFMGQSLFAEGNIAVALSLLVAGQPAFVAGIIEDLTKKVSVRLRLLASLASALLASWLLGATITEVDIWGVDTLLTWAPVALAVTAVVVAGGINAVNIIDGFNGLASATVAVMLAGLGAVGWLAGDMLIVELSLLGLGAAIGFFVVNYPTGRLFLGDGGAYFLGFWVAEVAVLLLARNPGVNAWQVLSICAYPIIEVLFSIYRRRYLRQSSPGHADGLHLHSLVYRRVVSRFFPIGKRHTWQRNAAVTFVMLPWVALSALLSVLAGSSVTGGIAIVCAQLLLYLAVYARIVRGQWRRVRAPLPVAGGPAGLDAEARYPARRRA